MMLIILALQQYNLMAISLTLLFQLEPDIA